MAVLPFRNLGAPDDEYFADGITEEISARLSKISGLIVISRGSARQYKNSPRAAQDIAKELGVRYVLAGTVRTDRRADGTGQVRVAPQLIRVESAYNEFRKDRLSEYAVRHDAEVTWYRGGANPVAVCRLLVNEAQPGLSLTALRVADGRVVIGSKGP